MQVENMQGLAPIDNSGIEVIADMRLIDLRQLRIGGLTAADEPSTAFVYRRMRIQKSEPTANRFTVRFRLPTEQVEVRTLNSRIPSTIHHIEDSAASDRRTAHIFDFTFDLSKVPQNEEKPQMRLTFASD
jgi:hypothetical protein